MKAKNKKIPEIIIQFEAGTDFENEFADFIQQILSWPQKNEKEKQFQPDTK